MKKKEIHGLRFLWYEGRRDKSNEIIIQLKESGKKIEKSKLNIRKKIIKINAESNKIENQIKFNEHDKVKRWSFKNNPR